jgi:hypothetical protein
LIEISLPYDATFVRLDFAGGVKPQSYVKFKTAGVVLLGAILFHADAAEAATSTVCDDAARIASNQTGVPLNVLLAITRTETGRANAGKLEPWPWTVNMEGSGKWFSSRDEALDYVSQSYNRGARSFDVGCFQINYRWHGEHFSSIKEMFDPEENAIYAANFLKYLNAEKKNWSAAAGAYHSRTIQYSTRYRNRFDEVLAALPQVRMDQILSQSGQNTALAHQDNEATDMLRDNQYPFFKNVVVEMRLGSLVPIGADEAMNVHLFSGIGD